MIRQFDICPLKRPRGPATHVVVMQHDGLSDLRTVLAAPLRPVNTQEPHPRLRPETHFAGKTYALALDMLAVIDKSLLGDAAASVEDCEYAIRRAIDMAFFGN